MANKSDVSRIKRGVEAWNAFQRAQGRRAADLQGAIQIGIDLQIANLISADLRDADLGAELARGWGSPIGYTPRPSTKSEWETRKKE
jgi:hypothetical protein